MADKISSADTKWMREQERFINDGEDIIDRAVEDALEYLSDAIENMNDKQWRKMTLSTQSVEMGIGVGLVERVAPVYDRMAKDMVKKLKVKKGTATVLRHIFIGRVVKNIRKELDARDK